MSAETLWNQTQLNPDPISSPSRLLRALPRPTHRATLPVLATVAVVVVVVLQLLISVALAGGAYQVEGLQAQKDAALRSQTAAAQALVSVQSPQYLAKQAATLGMVSNSNAVFLRLSDGAVLGVPHPAKGTTLATDNVPNALTDAPTPQVQTPAAAVPTQTTATPGQATTQTDTGSVALQNGGIPSIQTH